MLVTHPAFVLLDPGEQERRVTSWGRVLATVCRSGRIATLQVLERTLPDSGTGLAEWWASHGISDDSWAATTYAELIDRAGPAGERHATTLSLSLDMKAAARQIRTAGGGLRGAAAVLRQEMNTLVAALFATVAACGEAAGWKATATETYLFDVGKMPERATTIIAKMKAAGKEPKCAMTFRNFSQPMMHQGHITSETISTERRGTSFTAILLPARRAPCLRSARRRRAAILPRSAIGLTPFGTVVTGIVGHPPIPCAPIARRGRSMRGW